MNLASQDLVFRLATPADRAAWDGFLSTQCNATFYHLYDWSQVVELCFSHTPVYLMALQGGHVVGVLPMIEIRSRLFGNILCSLPFMNYGGPCAVSDDVSSQLVDEAISRAGTIECDYLELRCADRVPTHLVASLRKVSMTIALDPDPAVLWDRFTTKHRTNIRRAEKNQLVVKSGGIELLPELYALLEQSWRDLGTPLYPRSYFERILATFPQQTRLFVCFHGHRPICGAFNGHYGQTVEGMWAGAIPEARTLQANYVLYWEMIQYACRAGFRGFHLGRSTVDSGGDHFKRRWNAEQRQLFWYFHRPDGGPIPELNVDNPRYQLAISTWKRLPIWLVRRLGPQLAKSIP